MKRKDKPKKKYMQLVVFSGDKEVLSVPYAGEGPVEFKNTTAYAIAITAAKIRCPGYVDVNMNLRWDTSQVMWPGTVLKVFP